MIPKEKDMEQDKIKTVPRDVLLKDVGTVLAEISKAAEKMGGEMEFDVSIGETWIPVGINEVNQSMLHPAVTVKLVFNPLLLHEYTSQSHRQVPGNDQ
jgi:hypothetical protein